MQWRLQTLMLAVVAVAVAMGLGVHARSTIRADEDFGAAILFLQGVAAAIVGMIGLAAWRTVRIVRQDDAYAARLRRADLPSRCPIEPGDADPPISVCA